MKTTTITNSLKELKTVADFYGIEVKTFLWRVKKWIFRSSLNDTTFTNPKTV